MIVLRAARTLLELLFALTLLVLLLLFTLLAAPLLIVSNWASERERGRFTPEVMR